MGRLSTLTRAKTNIREAEEHGIVESHVVLLHVYFPSNKTTISAPKEVGFHVDSKFSA